jgi:transcriptional regulator with XRE-family HTH domain
MPMPFGAPVSARQQWADWFRETRKGKGLSQEKAAQQIGISRQQVIRWESAESLPDPETVQRIIAAFGTGVSETYRMAGQVPPKLEDAEADDMFATDLQRLVYRAPMHKRSQIKDAIRRQAETLVALAS